MNFFQKSYTLTEATKKMESYCAYQERCHKEVRQKLYDMRMIPEATELIITGLIEENYLNEERFATSFARGKFRIKKWGKNRITQELKQRNISKFNLNKALKELDTPEYLEVFNELAEKKAALISEQNILKKRKKLTDYLLYKGWESDLVYAKVIDLVPY